MADAVKTIAEAKGIVFVSAKGVDGIKMPLKKARETVTRSMGSEAAFVPVTDNWKSPKDVLAKDLALQLKADTGSKFPLILSISKDRYEKFAEKELDDGFKGNALVVLHAAPTDAKLEEIRGFHLKSKEILGESKPPKVFPEHIMSVMDIAKKLPKTPKVFLDAGGGFMIYDQAKHYLDAGIVGAVLALNVTLAKSEKMTIPYVYNNAEEMGPVEETKGVVKVIKKGDGTPAPAPAPANSDAGPDSESGADPGPDADPGASVAAAAAAKPKSKSGSKPASKPKSKSGSKPKSRSGSKK
eukprot:jgi/Tetstr1/447337/TSEL_034774.t1